MTTIILTHSEIYAAYRALPVDGIVIVRAQRFMVLSNAPFAQGEEIWNASEHLNPNPPALRPHRPNLLARTRAYARKRFGPQETVQP